MIINLYDYVAISIDFEGCIDIRKRVNKYKFIQYFVGIKITNTSKELLEHFQNKVKFGKICGPYEETNKTWKQKYQWCMNKKEIIFYTPLILPYLSLKWRQAELVIEVINIIKDIKYVNKLTKQEKKELYTFEEFLILESSYKECKKLNERGR